MTVKLRYARQLMPALNQRITREFTHTIVSAGRLFVVLSRIRHLPVTGHRCFEREDSCLSDPSTSRKSSPLLPPRHVKGPL